jgi:putative ABC transport system substrate-binding protein
MRRRKFITFIGGGVAALPFAALAQQPGRARRMPNVGILNYAAAEDTLVNEFRTALSELGHIEGQTLTITTYRWADGRFERLPSLAAELVANKVDVIIALGPATQRLPTMYGWREFVDEGGLMSYGPNVPVMVRKAASYVDRIIKGEKPGDLPIEQPVRLELTVNLKTAKALGFDIPPALLAVADAVIE